VIQVVLNTSAFVGHSGSQQQLESHAAAVRSHGQLQENASQVMDRDGMPAFLQTQPGGMNLGPKASRDGRLKFEMSGSTFE